MLALLIGYLLPAPWLYPLGQPAVGRVFLPVAQHGVHPVVEAGQYLADAVQRPGICDQREMLLEPQCLIGAHPKRTVFELQKRSQTQCSLGLGYG